MLKYEPLTGREVASVIDGRAKASRVPVYIHMWVHPTEFGDREPAVREILSRYSEDIQLVPVAMPAQYRGQYQGAPDYAWLPWPAPQAARQTAIDAQVGLDDWGRLDEVIEKFPDPSFPGLWNSARARDGRYRMAHWWFCLFERHWSLRGMTNALMDYYTNPTEVHRLFRALTDFYVGIIDRAGREQQCDGIWTSDDLGTQTGEFFSPKIFREFYKPYYKEMIDKAHQHKMHFWLHACGNVKQFIPEWIDIGLDVLHPIQKHTMDEREIAARFGDKITIFAGMDVQQVIPWGSPDDVRREVRFLIDTYWRPGEGRCMITAGNGINGDCTLASLEAFYDEAFSYGTQVTQR